MAKKKRNKPTLKGSLIFTELVCLVLPLFLILGVLGYASSAQIQEQVLSGVTENIESSAEVCASQLESAINASYGATYNSDDIAQAYLAYKKGTEDVRGNADELYSRVTSYLKSQYRYDSRFDLSMLCYLDEPDQIYFAYDAWGTSFSHFSDYHTRLHPVVMQYAKKLDTSVGFFLDNQTDALYLVRNLSDVSDFRPYAVLILQLNRETFFQNLTNIPYSQDVSVWLGDTPVTLKGTPVSQADMNQLGKSRNRNITFVSGSRQFDSCQLRYAVRLDSSMLTRTLAETRMLVLILALLTVPLLLMAIRFFYRNVTGPISGFEAVYRKLEQGELGVHLEKEFPSREFDYFANSFNHMSDRLKRQFEQIYSDELAIRDARIMALQSQINPHFLNNTLEIINWEARMGGNERVSEMIGALSTMLDAAMDRGHNPEVTLEKELEYVNAYLFIIGERFGKKLQVEKEIDETLLSCRVPRLIMQPILENAVEHGVEGQKDGRICLHIFGTEKQLILEVENSGLISEEDERKIAMLLSEDSDTAGMRSNSLGIHNVHQRLRILYGGESGLTIGRSENGTARARLVIPRHEQASGTLPAQAQASAEPSGDPQK